MDAKTIRKVLDDLDARVEAMWKEREEAQASDPDLDTPLICSGVGLVGRCTDTATWLAIQLGGDVYGYEHKNNPDAELGTYEFGHDFVVVDGRWLVDWWAKDTYQLPDLYDLEDPAVKDQVRRVYGDPARWEKLPRPEVESYRVSLGV
jgi:hypothetical protein